MSRKRKGILIGAAAAVLIAGIGSVIIARVLVRRVEPYVREQTVHYLSEHLGADVQLAALHVQLPAIPKLQLLWTRGRGSLASVVAEGAVIRRRGRPQEPPVLAMKSFRFDVDLGRVFDARKAVRSVHIEGLELHIPPRSERSGLSAGALGQSNNVLIDELEASDTLLVIHPADAKKMPLKFAIQHLVLRDVGLNRPMTYVASLRNPRPPGQIESKGTFGPWNKDDPGSSALAGSYTFAHADLGIFKAIAGILESTGTFVGELSRLQVRGETRTPDFRLKEAGNAIPLTTHFEAEVDGTNGNTTLKPVQAQLGRSSFTTSGAVIKFEDDPRRTIDLTVKMAAGRVEDFMRLAVKGTPALEGALRLDAKIGIPPLSGTVAQRLRLNGSFEISDGKFLKSTIQDRLDELSRKGQGQPRNEAIDEVVSQMTGAFKMDNRLISFSRLTFGVEGADVDLTGNYDLGADALDFRGSLKLKAKVSQTQTGIKRWVLKPIDPLFAKNGAGTFLHIRINGSREHVSFGLDRHNKQDGK